MLPSLGGLDITFNLCFALELAVRWISEAPALFSPHKWIRSSFSLWVIPCFFLFWLEYGVFFLEICQTFSELFLLSGLHTLSRLRQPCLQVASWLQQFLCQLSSCNFWIGLMTYCRLQCGMPLDWSFSFLDSQVEFISAMTLFFSMSMSVFLCYLWISKWPNSKVWKQWLISWPLTCTSLFLALWKDMIRMATDDQRD